MRTAFAWAPFQNDVFGIHANAPWAAPATGEPPRTGVSVSSGAAFTIEVLLEAGVVAERYAPGSANGSAAAPVAALAAVAAVAALAAVTPVAADAVAV
jgi:hypothetical protein